MMNVIEDDRFPTQQDVIKEDTPLLKTSNDIVIDLPLASQGDIQPPKQPVIACEICYDIIPEPNPTSTIKKSECNHSICSNCMQLFIKTLIAERAHESKFVCPSNGCSRPITRQEILQHAGEDNARAYSSLVASQNEEMKKIMKCADCNEPLKPIDYENHDILVCKSLKCQASKKKDEIDAYCFYCKSKIEWKVEASLSYQAWASFTSSLNKLRYRGRTSLNESFAPSNNGRNLNYVHICKNEDARAVRKFSVVSHSNVKHCPQCFHVIQKNEGCSHMHCQYCNYHFCWDCLECQTNHGACPAHQSPLHKQFLGCVVSFGRNFGSVIYRNHILIVLAILFVLSPIFYPFYKIFDSYKRWRDKKKHEEFAIQQNRRIQRTICGLDVIVFLTDNSAYHSPALYDSSLPSKGYLYDLGLQSRLVVRDLLRLDESRGRWMNYETEEVSPNFHSSFQPDATFISHEFETATLRVHIKLAPRAKIDGLPVLHGVNSDFVIRVVEPISTAYNESRAARSAIEGKYSL